MEYKKQWRVLAKFLLKIFIIKLKNIENWESKI